MTLCLLFIHFSHLILVTAYWLECIHLLHNVKLTMYTKQSFIWLPQNVIQTFILVTKYAYFLKTGVNLNKILQASFLYKSETSSFSTCNLGLKVCGAKKSAEKLLVKCW
jgi:hypothetical protein